VSHPNETKSFSYNKNCDARGNVGFFGVDELPLSIFRSSVLMSRHQPESSQEFQF
jgi:hypothetical protein